MSTTFLLVHNTRSAQSGKRPMHSSLVLKDDLSGSSPSPAWPCCRGEFSVFAFPAVAEILFDFGIISAWILRFLAPGYAKATSSADTRYIHGSLSPYLCLNIAPCSDYSLSGFKSPPDSPPGFQRMCRADRRPVLGCARSRSWLGACDIVGVGSLSSASENSILPLCSQLQKPSRNSFAFWVLLFFVLCCQA